MDGPIRVPPRFVPTLTSVVDLEAEPAPLPAVEPEPAATATQNVQAQAESTHARVFIEVEPRVAPALPPEPERHPVAPALDSGTEWAWGRVAADAVPLPELPEWSVAPKSRVEPQDTAASSATASDNFKAISPIHEADAFRLEEELLHRVLQRVDLSLEERLTEVVSATVQHQLDAMIPRLRAEVESALRQLVVEAMAHELLENPGSATGSGAPSLG